MAVTKVFERLFLSIPVISIELGDLCPDTFFVLSNEEVKITGILCFALSTGC